MNIYRKLWCLSGITTFVLLIMSFIAVGTSLSIFYIGLSMICLIAFNVFHLIAKQKED